MYIYACICIWMYMRSICNIYIYVCVYTYVSRCMYIYICMCVCVCRSTSLCVIYTYISIRMYIIIKIYAIIGYLVDGNLQLKHAAVIEKRTERAWRAEIDFWKSSPGSHSSAEVTTRYRKWPPNYVTATESWSKWQQETWDRFFQHQNTPPKHAHC